MHTMRTHGGRVDKLQVITLKYLTRTWRRAISPRGSIQQFDKLGPRVSLGIRTRRELDCNPTQKLVNLPFVLEINRDAGAHELSSLDPVKLFLEVDESAVSESSSP
jgi:hypothetical protein